MAATPIDVMMDALEWQQIEFDTAPDGDLPYATHFGVLKIGEVELNCVQLNTGERLITEESVVRFLEALHGDVS